MPEKSLLENLPTDLVQQVASFLDPKAIAEASKVSKAWSLLFNNDSIWKYKLKKEFGVDFQIVSKLFKAEEIVRNKIFYKQLYARFRDLSQHRLPGFIKNIYLDKTQLHLIILACNNKISYLDNLTLEQQYLVAVLAIYAGCFSLPRSYIVRYKNLRKTEPANLQFEYKELLKNLLEHAAISGNFQVVQYLLNPENRFDLQAERYIQYHAASSGNLQLVEYLLNTKNQSELQADISTLDWAAFSGNLQLVQFILNAKPINLKPDLNTLNSAAASGNLQLVQHLLKQFGLQPDNQTLPEADQSGNLQLVKYLLDHFSFESKNAMYSAAKVLDNLQFIQYLNKYEIKPNKDTLDNAAESDNEQLVQYLLKSENNFGLISNNNTLDCATTSGNLELVQYLLNEFRLKPTQDTLNCAAYSGNLQLVQYLEDPKNNFGLIADDQTLNEAAKSGNLQLMQHLLNPNSHPGLQVTQNTFECAARAKNFALVKFLLPSHFLIQVALSRLKTLDLEEGKTLLNLSLTHCTSHHQMMMEYILNNRLRFNLNEQSIQILNEHKDRLFEGKKNEISISLNF